MKLNKGDLIAISSLDDQRETAIVAVVFSGHKYFYCYLIESDSYRLIYKDDVEFVITEKFDPSIGFDEDLFNLDYSFYEAYHRYFYTTFYGFSSDFDDDSDDDGDVK